MRGDMGLATLILFVVIIIMATIAAVIMLQATNAVKTQASQTYKESSSKFGKRFVVDKIYVVVDMNANSENYRKGKYMWLQARLPEGGMPIDLRKVIMNVEINNYLKIGVKYNDADGSEPFGENACEQDSPYPAEEGGDVNYEAFENGDFFTAVWLQCNGKNEDWIVYPGQLVMLIYSPPEGIPEGAHIKITISVSDGGVTEIDTEAPELFNKKFVEFSV